MNKKLGALVIALSSVILIGLILMNVNQNVRVYVNYVGGGENYTISIKKGSTIQQPANPVLEGFSFECWSVNGKEFDFNRAINEDTTLLATYEKAYQVTFVSEEVVIKEMVVSQGDLAVAPTNIANGDFVFKGWYNDEKAYSLDEPVMRDLILTAKWANPIDYLKGDTEIIKMEPYEMITITNRFYYAPNDAHFTPIYTSSNPEVVKVDENGDVVSVSLGSASITMKVGTLEASIQIEVVKPAIRSITTPATVNVDVGGTIQLQSYVIPENADLSTLKYSIEDSELASIDETGLITAKKAGVTKVYAKSNDVIAETQLYINGSYLQLDLLDSIQTYYPNGPKIDYSLTIVSYLNGERSEEDLRNNPLIILNDESNDACLTFDNKNDLRLNVKNKKSSSETFFFTYDNYTSNTVTYKREPALAITFKTNCGHSSSYKEGLCLVMVDDLTKPVSLSTNFKLVSMQATSGAIITWSYDNNLLTFMVNEELIDGSETAFVAISDGGQTLEIRVSGTIIKP